MMQDMIVHRAETRGQVSNDWLTSFHTFSFGNYYNADRIRFGALRVLNDDTVAAGRGFGTHPHDNMEIISIPLDGELEHQDSLGNSTVIRKGDVQIMSAGTGVFHSEFNHHEKEIAKFLQIWIYPNKMNVEPRYGQLSLDLNDGYNQLQQIVSPNADDAGLWIHQEAWLFIGKFDSKKVINYLLKKEENGVYLLVLDGQVQVGEESLGPRDAIGLSNTSCVVLTALSSVEFLLIEVPMVF